MRILLAESDDLIAGDLSTVLTATGYNVERADFGPVVMLKGDTEEFAAIILALALPGADGLAILRHWRAAGRRMPVLALAAAGTRSERFAGIDAGADDYLPKPFRPEEVLARLSSIVRRPTGVGAGIITVGTIMLDPRTMRVTRGGMLVGLTPQEYRLFSHLMHHVGRIVPHLELMQQLYAGETERNPNALEVLIGRLRRKVGAATIETRRGLGYIVNNIPAQPDGGGSGR
jgi:DNA-binding response OmpR family regulator